MNIVKKYHSELLKYKNIHVGDVCYIFGSGPTFNRFKIQEEGIFIGCNHIIKNKYIRENIKYYFFGHGYKIYNNPNSICGNHKQEVDELGNRISKFAMVSRDNNISVHHFTKEDIENLKNINAIPCDINLNFLYKNLDKNPFLNHSIIFPAVQFALYCNFTKIYLVGCDCNLYKQDRNRKYFFDDNSKNVKLDYNIIQWWKKIYKFKNKEYSNTKLININPVGLKGMMDQDIYL